MITEQEFHLDGLVGCSSPQEINFPSVLTALKGIPWGNHRVKWADGLAEESNLNNWVKASSLGWE